MSVALIVLFVSLAVCALIGWGFVRALGAVGAKLRRQAQPPVRTATGPTIIFRTATAEELAASAELASVRPAAPAVETYFERGQWKNKVQGNTRASNVHQTREAAVEVGREMAQKRRTRHVIRADDDGPTGHSARGDEAQSVVG